MGGGNLSEYWVCGQVIASLEYYWHAVGRYPSDNNNNGYF